MFWTKLCKVIIVYSTLEGPLLQKTITQLELNQLDKHLNRLRLKTTKNREYLGNLKLEMQA